MDIKELMKLDLPEREVAIYNELKKIDCGEHIEKLSQGGVQLSYLSWAWAVDTLSSILPMSYKVLTFEDENGIPKPFVFDRFLGYMVFTEITILGITKQMYLPVMDTKNKAMKHEAYSYQTKGGSFSVAPANMFDINKTIMRCLVKNISMFGLGLYIYAGEDLPPREIEYITEEQLNEFKKLEINVANVLKKFNITDVKYLEKSQADFVINSKKRYLEQQATKKGE